MDQGEDVIHNMDPAEYTEIVELIIFGPTFVNEKIVVAGFEL